MPTASTIWCSNTDNIIREHQGLTSTVLRSVDVTSIANTDLVSVTTDGTVTGSEANPIFAYAGGGVQHVVKLQGFTTTPISITDHAVDWDMTGVTWDGVHLLTSANGDVDSGDLLQKWDGLTTTLKESITIGDVNPVGITWDGEDCIFTARWRFSAKGVIRRLWGFSGTTRTAISTDTTVGIGNADPSDVSFDGTDVLFSGDSPQRIYRLTGYTATVAAFLDVTVNPDGMEHGVYSERQPQTDLEGPYACGFETDRILQFLGMSSSILRQASVSAIDNLVKDICFDGTDIIIAGDTNNRITKLDGFSSTIKSDFFVSSSIGLEAVTWDGENIIIGFEQTVGGDRVQRLSGFSSTLDQSLAIGGFETLVRGVTYRAGNLYIIGSSGFLRRMNGFSTTTDVAIAIPGGGVSYNATNPIVVRSQTTIGDDVSPVQELDGFTTTVLRQFGTDHVDSQVWGLEHDNFDERLAEQAPIRLRHTQPTRRRKKDPPLRSRLRPYLASGLDSVLAGWPLATPQRRRAPDVRPAPRRQPQRHVPLAAAFAVLPDPDDVFWLGSSTDTAFLHDGFTTTQRTSVALSSISSGLFGITFDGTDMIVGDAVGDRVVRTEGLTSSIKDEFSVSDTGITGVSWDGTGVRWTGDSGNTINRNAGFTGTMVSTVTVTSIDTLCRGACSLQGDPMFIGATARFANRLVGYTTTIRASADLNSLSETGLSDLTWDGTNLIVSGFGNDDLYRLTGFSSTLDTSFDVSGSDGAPWGVEIVDFNLRGGTLEFVVFPTPRSRRVVPKPPQRSMRGMRHYFPSGQDATVAGWPLRILKTRRIESDSARALRRRKARARKADDGGGIVGSGVSHRYFMARGVHRIFNQTLYRIWRKLDSPPAETDPTFSVSTTLPHTPSGTFSDGTWYVAVSFFNGVLDSGFLPVGPNGEPYLKLIISSGQAQGTPPNGPLDFRLIVSAGGVIRVVALYLQTDALKATEWAITYTTNGSDPGTPPAVSPTITQAMGTSNVAVLDYALPAQANGTTVKVRLQTRRNDGTWVYSTPSIVRTAVADAAGPAAPLVGMTWPGLLPEN